MIPNAGYYSLVQFCPDASRLEAVNVGVVLFCPEIAFLEVKMTKKTGRIARVFGKGKVRLESLAAAQQAIIDRLHSNYRPHNLPEFEHYINTRGNELVLSPPRPMKVIQPSDELKRLFAQLVEQPPRKKKEGEGLAPDLVKVFKSLVRAGRAEEDLEEPVPVIGKTISIPYAYRNGVLNLVKPQRFSVQKDTAMNTAVRLAVEGDMIARHGGDAQGGKQLVIVASFESPDREADTRRRVLELLKEYREKVKTVAPEDVPAFAQQVLQEAKPELGGGGPGASGGQRKTEE